MFAASYGYTGLVENFFLTSSSGAMNVGTIVFVWPVVLLAGAVIAVLCGGSEK